MFKFQAWIDSSPLIYKNNDRLSLVDTSTLNLSQYKHYTLYINDPSFYMDQFINKMRYVSRMGNRSHNQSSCTAVFMSFFASPVWTEIGCDYPIKSNYFLCEINTRGYFVKHPGLNIAFGKACRYGYTFVNGDCWGITWRQIVRRRRFLQLSRLRNLLCSWSLGDPLRNVIGLHFTESTNKCLKTNSSSIQRYKNWILHDDCSTATATLKQSAIVTSSPCQGKYVVCRKF